MAPCCRKSEVTTLPVSRSDTTPISVAAMERDDEKLPDYTGNGKAYEHS
jgi:hypothetical protein